MLQARLADANSLDSILDCNRYMNAVLARHAGQFGNAEAGPLYGMNLELSALDFLLKDVPYNISPSRNKLLRACLGVNVPTFYISSDGSFTPIHPEDGYLDSCNLIRWGLPGACKIWLFVDRRDNDRMMRAVVAEIAAWRRRGVRLAALGDGCSLPLHHKVWALSTDFLDRYNIRYECVRQEPGDLVFVAGGVYHQVVNVGVTFAEAVNVGSVAWNLTGHLFTTCETCAAHGRPNGVRYIPPNEDVSVTLKERVVRRFVCNYDQCPFSCTVAREYQAHLRTHRPASSRVEVYACARCGHPAFASRSSLNRHINRLHSEVPPEPMMVACPLCGLLLTAPKLNRHLAGSCRGGA